MKNLALLGALLTIVRKAQMIQKASKPKEVKKTIDKILPKF